VNFTDYQTIGEDNYRVTRVASPLGELSYFNVDYLIVLLQNVIATEVEQKKLENQTQQQFLYLVLILIASSLTFTLVIWGRTLRFTNQITNPIIELTKITEMVKQASGKDSREKIVQVIQSQPIFEQTKKLIQQEQFRKQQASKS